MDKRGKVTFNSIIVGIILICFSISFLAIPYFLSVEFGIFHFIAFLFIMIISVLIIIFTNKNEQFIIYGIIFFVAMLLGIYLWTLSYYGGNCVISQNEINMSESGNYLYKAGVWVKENLFYCGRDAVANSFIENSISFIKDKLGFNQTFYDFFYPDLVVGLLVGLMFWGLFIIATKSILLNVEKWIEAKYHGKPFSDVYKEEVNKIKSKYLGFIGSSFWKVIPVAVFYAVLMQIPLINSFIDVIVLAPILDSIFLRAIMVAFYIGLLPSLIESYARYRIRMKYYKHLIEVKYGIRTMREFGRG